MTLADVVAHLRKSMQSLPSSTVTRFVVTRGAFSDVDGMHGRGALEEMVGHSRLFEIQLEQTQSQPVRLGGEAPTGYTDRIPVRVRYDLGGNSERAAMVTEIRRDQQALIDAIYRSNWADVAGLASLSAEPGDISSFELGDENGRTFEGLISEIVVNASYDV